MKFYSACARRASNVPLDDNLDRQAMAKASDTVAGTNTSQKKTERSKSRMATKEDGKKPKKTTRRGAKKDPAPGTEDAAAGDDLDKLECVCHFFSVHKGA